MNDSELLYYFHLNDEESHKMLIQRFKKKIHHIINKVCDELNYHFVDSDEREEIYQRCLITLFNCADDYRDDGGASFSSYLNKCLDTSVRLYIRSMRSKSRRIISEAIRLDESVMESEALYRIDIVENDHKEFEPNYYRHKSTIENIFKELVNQLSEKEMKVLRMRANGYTCREIGEILHTNTKNINYICMKLKKVLASFID